MGRRDHPPEFQRRVLDRSRQVRPARCRVAEDLGITDQSIYNWRRHDQARIGRGLETGLSTTERAELTAARKRIRPSRPRSLSPSGTKLLKDRLTERRFTAIAVVSAEGLPFQVECRVLGVPKSG